MEELDKIIDDYLSDCFHEDNDKPYTVESILTWWKSNREKYDSEIVGIIQDAVSSRLMRMIFEEGNNKDLSEN